MSGDDLYFGNAINAELLPGHADPTDRYRRAAAYVDRILEGTSEKSARDHFFYFSGATPSDLVVEARKVVVRDGRQDHRSSRIGVQWATFFRWQRQ